MKIRSLKGQKSKPNGKTVRPKLKEVQVSVSLYFGEKTKDSGFRLNEALAIYADTMGVYD
jgi:hypothetical protein